jgi:hypothetical protein
MVNNIGSKNKFKAFLPIDGTNNSGNTYRSDTTNSSSKRSQFKRYFAYSNLCSGWKVDCLKVEKEKNNEKLRIIFNIRIVKKNCTAKKWFARFRSNLNVKVDSCSGRLIVKN